VAALELTQNFETIRRKWIDIWSKDFGHKISLGIKCGINTGEVLFGLLDTDTRSQGAWYYFQTKIYRYGPSDPSYKRANLHARKLVNQKLI
jgi:hypothetical protein